MRIRNWTYWETGRVNVFHRTLFDNPIGLAKMGASIFQEHLYAKFSSYINAPPENIFFAFRFVC